MSFASSPASVVACLLFLLCAAPLVFGAPLSVLADLEYDGILTDYTPASFSTTPLPWQAGIQNNYTYSHSSGVRLFYLYVPSSYDASKNVSLVLCFHGLTSHAMDFAFGSNMTRKAEEVGFILLYPQGSTGYRGTGWNAGTCCLGDPSNVDDIGFIRDIIDLTRATFLIRDDSIHSMGFSNGGFMSETIACQLPSIRSIASVSGNTIPYPGNDAGLRACDASYAALGSTASILHVHGDADPIVKYKGDPAPPNSFPPIPTEMDAWATRNACGIKWTQTLNVTTFTNQVWTECPGEYQTIELVVNHGGGHEYPMNPAQGFVVTDYIIQFMEERTPGGL